VKNGVDAGGKKKKKKKEEKKKKKRWKMELTLRKKMRKKEKKKEMSQLQKQEGSYPETRTSFVSKKNNKFDLNKE
jgi:hypothetical protein